MSNAETSNTPQSPHNRDDQNSIFNSPGSPPIRDHRPVSPARMAATGAAIIVAIAAVAFTLFKSSYEDHSVRNDLESIKEFLSSPAVSNSPSGGLEIVPSAMPSAEDIARARIEAAEKIALGRATLDAFARGIGSLEQKANDLLLKQKGLDDELQKIETSDIGRKIANRPELVNQFAKISNSVSKQNEISADALSFASVMKEFLSNAELDSVADFRPSNDSVVRLRELTSQIDRKLEDISQSTGLLNAIKTRSKDEAAGSISLREQIANLKCEVDSNYLDTEIEVTAEAEKQSLADFGDKIRESAKDRADSKAGVQVAANKLVTSSNNNQIADIEEKRRQDERLAQEALAYQKLKNEFDLVRGDIEIYLVPFTSPGLKHRGKHSGRGPVSYAVMVSENTLYDTISGRSKLSYLAHNDRPRGSFPTPIAKDLISYPMFAGKVQFIERAQALIRKFHPVLIEEGLLAK